MRNRANGALGPCSREHSNCALGIDPRKEKEVDCPCHACIPCAQRLPDLGYDWQRGEYCVLFVDFDLKRVRHYASSQDQMNESCTGYEVGNISFSALHHRFPKGQVGGFLDCSLLSSEMAVLVCRAITGGDRASIFLLMAHPPRHFRSAATWMQRTTLGTRGSGTQDHYLLTPTPDLSLDRIPRPRTTANVAIENGTAARFGPAPASLSR